jgi:hypothetical protein
MSATARSAVSSDALQIRTVTAPRGPPCTRRAEPARAHCYGAKPLSDEELIREAREAFELAADAEAENRREALLAWLGAMTTVAEMLSCEENR